MPDDDDEPHLLLGMERIKPGEGKLTAAKRLLKEAASRNNEYSDTISTDALYKVAPLMREVMLGNSWTAVTDCNRGGGESTTPWSLQLHNS